MKNSILTLESEYQPPDKYVVYTKAYGETISSLKPGYDEVKKHEKQYRMEVPSEVMDICKELKGIGGRALLVGGSVRDMMISQEYQDMKLVPKDFDLEVYGISPDTLQKVLETKFGIENIDSVGKAFGILKVRIEGWDEPLDFSIPRHESKNKEGHTGFSITGDPAMSIEEAARRRDLTINTMAYDPLTETVYDPFHGYDDIRNQILEVTDPEAFKEDPLRVLRVMQFSARFGFLASPRTKELCKVMVESGEMDTEPKERITEEVKKMLTKGRKPSLGLEFAREVGFVEKYWPTLYALIGTQQEEAWHPEGDGWKHTLQTVDAAANIAFREKLSKEQHLVLMLSSLCHDSGKPSTTVFKDGAYRSHGHEQAGVEPTKDFLRNFIFPRDVEKQVLALIPEHLAPKYFWDQEVNHGENMNRAVNRLAVRLGNAGTSIKMLAFLAEADQRGRNPEGNAPLTSDEVPDLKNWQTWLLNKTTELKVENKPPERMLSGGLILKRLGLTTGDTWVGVVGDCVYADQLDGNIKSQEDALVKALEYKSLLEKKVQEKAVKDRIPEREVWMHVKRTPDPRVFVTEQQLY